MSKAIYTGKTINGFINGDTYNVKVKIEHLPPFTHEEWVSVEGISMTFSRLYRSKEEFEGDWRVTE